MIGRRSHDDAQSFADALDGQTPKDAHIADLVRLAESLCEAAAAEPTVAFRASLRAQLMADAPTVLVVATPNPLRVAYQAPARRRLAAATAALVASAGVVGLVSSSASAVPGDMLYSVKRTVESAELVLHRSDSSRGAYQLSQASERLAEARALSADGRSPGLIAETLDDFAASATTGSSRLFDDFSTSGTKKSVQQVNRFAVASSLGLAELSAELPDGAGDSLAAASAAVTEVAGEAATLCASCEPADVGPLSSIASLASTTAAPAAKPSARAPAKPSPSAAGPRATAPSTPSASRTTAPPAPTRTPPPTIATPATPLAPLTDPLLGALLGDDDQEGLVPGLVNGLLGGTPKQ